MDIMLQCCCIESMYRGCSRTENCDIMLQCCCIKSQCTEVVVGQRTVI